MLSRCQVTQSTPSISPSYPANSTKHPPTHTPAHLPSNSQPDMTGQGIAVRSRLSRPDTPTHRHPAQHRGEQSQSRSGRDPISYRSVYHSSIYPLSYPSIISQRLTHLLSSLRFLVKTLTYPSTSRSTSRPHHTSHSPRSSLATIQPKKTLKHLRIQSAGTGTRIIAPSPDFLGR